MKQMSWTQVWMFLLLAGFDNGRFRFNYTHLRTYKGGGVRRGPRVYHVAKSLKGKVSVSYVFLKLIIYLTTMTKIDQFWILKFLQLL